MYICLKIYRTTNIYDIQLRKCSCRHIGRAFLFSLPQQSTTFVCDMLRRRCCIFVFSDILFLAYLYLSMQHVATKVVPNLLVDQVRKFDNRKNRGICRVSKPTHFVQLESTHQFFELLFGKSKKGRRGMGKNLPEQPGIHSATKGLKK